MYPAKLLFQKLIFQRNNIPETNVVSFAFELIKELKKLLGEFFLDKIIWKFFRNLFLLNNPKDYLLSETLDLTA